MNDEKEIGVRKDVLLSILNDTNEKENDMNNIEEEQEIIFRNYIPQDRNFKIEKCYKLNEVKSIEDKIKANVLKSVKEFLNLEKSNNLIKPPKRDFDLKRNITQKMNYLNELTNEAIKEIAPNPQSPIPNPQSPIPNPPYY